MSEEKQNGDQQPSVEVKSEVVCHKYIVYPIIKGIDDKSYYELISQDSNIKVKILYIEVSKIVLAPDMILSISSENLNNGDILNIEEFDEDTCLRLKEKHKVCLYKSSKFQILFPDEVKELNYLYSGVVMQNMDSVVEVDRKLFLHKPYGAEVYEVKLDSQITIKSIDRVFKKIYLYSDDGILNGFKVEKLKIDAESLFNCNHNSTIDKSKLRAKFAKKEDVLSEDNNWLLKKASFYKFFTKLVKYFSLSMIVIVIVLSILTTNSFFTIGLSILALIIAILFYLGISNKVKILDDFVLIRKDDIYKVFRDGNITGSIFSFLFILFFMYSYSVTYKYKTDYVYDSVKQEFLDSNSFVVDKSLVFKTDKILNRYIPVKTNYSFDLLIDNPNELPTFAEKYIDLKVSIVFKKGMYLLDSNLTDKIEKIRVIFTQNLNHGLYGNFYSMNNFEYRKALIEVEEDINNVLEAILRKDSNTTVISNINIITEYAKLQNVD